MADFDGLLKQYLIDHRWTSPHHPQADGLAERGVQTFKRALRKYGDTATNKDRWDEALPQILLGYNCSPQASSKYTPYELLYARTPHVPPAVQERFAEPVNLDDPVLAADLVLQRAAWVARHAPAAGNNLAIAQHRDKLMYARRRNGAYAPKTRTLAVGDYVYYQRAPDNALEVKVAREVYRITDILDTGVAVLMGRCGRTFKAHISTLALCHLPIDGAVDHTLARPTVDLPCEICNETEDWQHMLLCDGCGKGFHTFCLTPPLADVPTADIWVCPACVGEGVTADQVKQRQQHVANIMQNAPTPISQDHQVGSTRIARQQLDGRLVLRPATRQCSTPLWGVVKYLGPKPKDKCFELQFVDGTVTHELNMTQVRKWLQPPGTLWPSHLPPMSASVLPNTGESLTTVEHWLTALRTRLPGVWNAKQASQFMTGWQAELQAPATPQELPLAPLLQQGAILDLPTSHRSQRQHQYLVLNPFSYFTAMPSVLHDANQRPMAVLNTDACVGRGADHFVNPLSSTSLATVIHKAGIKAIISSAPSFVLDMFLPLATAMNVLVAVYVTSDYITAAPQPRAMWLSKFTQSQRMKCVWLSNNMCWLILIPATVPDSSEQLQLSVMAGVANLPGPR